MKKSSAASTPSSSSVPSANSRRMRSNAAGTETDVAWEYGVEVGYRRVKCKFCNEECTGHQNVMACNNVPEEVKAKIQNILEQNELASKKRKGVLTIDEVEQPHQRGKCTNCKELLRPGATRFATSYLTLIRLNELKGSLISMFASEKWGNSNFAKSEVGKNIESIILDNVGFWRSVYNCCLAAAPLIRVLRMVDSDLLAMGYIFDAMVKAKIEIKNLYKDVKSRCEPVLDIIDQRWETEIQRPLHVAGHYLNPQMQYSPDFGKEYYGFSKKIFYERLETILKLSGREERKRKEDDFGVEQHETFEDVDSDDGWITEDNEDLTNIYVNEPTTDGANGDGDFLEHAIRNQYGGNEQSREESSYVFEDGNEVEAAKQLEIID
ncbi:hypothetical protein CTI12_AA409670 [Artemisia annua]|uniref:Uncharacterized protein n=1 Tax=Artemisia annua TaxID=35608 RepID=A0A2U1M934_ARTAN|nr:hypothetical protein CTI12_AA409670 [Artemisia annua]